MSRVNLTAQVQNRLGYVAVMVLASLTRLWNLGYPPKLVFDETYYVKDALTLSVEGHEKKWPENFNESFESGEVFGYLSEPAFVVHPPLGKWLIAAGMWLVGPDSSLGWRLAVAIAGIASVGLIMVIAWKLFGSHRMAIASGFLLAIDGLAISLSRTALLDGLLTFFLLLGFLFFLMDQDRSRVRITGAVVSGSNTLLWFRPFLILTGITLGLASAIKWSGLYLLAGIGLYVVFSELALRRRSGEKNFLVKGMVFQGGISFINLVPVAVFSYLSTWTGWILSSGGYSRNWAEENSLPGIFGSLPNWLQSLWNYHEAIYKFHIGLDTAHAYASHPISWLLGLRPTAFFFESYSFGENGCLSEAGCSSAITALGNPLIWWAATAALLALCYRYLVSRERVVGLVLLGVGSLYLPWLLLSSRTVFQFYAVSFQPWMILGLVLVLQGIYSKLRTKNELRAKRLVIGYFAIVALLASFFLPIHLGVWIPFDLWQWRMWLPSWI